ncbi:glycosyltransferase family 2 protein [Thioalkalivibrio thiocyanoxidans]|uniref:glycosyltransferase family 2 protein n=1 Tax=Thioalkalivibrio thiocyanoxidans TaxID=152475 RepID=UPI0003A6139F|nr:glycosyltransferase family A protein [Thioalkalivibrio thiocyanoxidans]
MSGSPLSPSKRHSNSAAEDSSRLVCSVIVPVYNHWGLVPGLLDCLQAQTFPQESFEVLLVDNGSTDYEPPESLPDNVRILNCETPGSYAARNIGIEAAAGDWLAFTDADCRPDPRWLEAMFGQAQQEGQRALLAGAVEMYTDSACPNAYEIYDLIRGIPQAHYVRRGYAATANLLVHRSVMAMLGGFDSTRYSGGDAAFCRRACASSYSIQFVSDAVVRHPARESWKEVVSKARRIKGGQVLSGTMHARAYWALRTLMPPLHLYYRYAMAREYSLRYRVIALAVQSRLWGHELHEMLRLLLRPARRERQ